MTNTRDYLSERIDANVREVKRHMITFSIAWIALGIIAALCAILVTYTFWQIGGDNRAVGAMMCFAAIGWSIWNFRKHRQWCRDMLARLSRLRAEAEKIT